MNIRINPIRTNVAAVSVALIASCCSGASEKQAKQDALPYLSANELLIAEKTAKTINPSDAFFSEQLVYWDSILVEHKLKDAYYDGKEYAVNAYNGEVEQKKEYPVFLDKPNFDITLSQDELIDFIMIDVAEYCSAKEYNDLRDKQPTRFNDFGKEDSYKAVKFWRDIRTAFRQRAAFAAGEKDANDSLKALRMPQMQVLITK